MADHFVDSVNGNDANSAHTMDAALATVAYAAVTHAIAAGDIIWVRRNVAEIPTADIAPSADGTPVAPIRVIGWPRNSHSISSSNWTNGSPNVVVNDANMVRTRHQARYITAPNGHKYLITWVVDASNITLDREYCGTTVTNQAATIWADEDYDLAQAIDDSSWTIKKSVWNADPDDVPCINFNGGAYQWYHFAAFCWTFNNLEFKDSSDSAGIFYVRAGKNLSLIGCLFKQSSSNTRIVYIYGQVQSFMCRCVVEGSGSGSSQFGVDVGGSVIGPVLCIKDCAIYNCGANGLTTSSRVFIENINIGVEVANGNTDILITESGVVIGRDVNLGGTNGYVSIATSGSSGALTRVNVENYQKILGIHRSFYIGGYIEKQVTPDGTIVNKKISDYVLKITPNISNYVWAREEWMLPVLEHVIQVTATSKSYRYWIFNNAMGTLNDSTAKDNIFLKVEYIAAYDDTSEYVIKTEYSTQIDIANAANADDWDYLEVTGINPAIASKVRLTIYLSAYSAAGTIYIDPAVVIS